MKFLVFLLSIAIASGIHIGCRFSRGFWIPNEEIYYCNVISMNFTGNSTHMTGFDGFHLWGYTRFDVEGIRIFENCTEFNLKTIPKNVQRFFPNIKAFRINTCPIDVLNGDEFNEYHNLQYVSLMAANLTRLPPNLFAENLDMRSISVYNSPIRHIGETLVAHLQHLVQGSFHNLECMSMSSSNRQLLREVFRTNCTDIEIETTTTIPPRCEINEIEDFVCGLEEEIENLRLSNEILKESDETLRLEIEELKISNEKLIRENEEIRQLLAELEQRINELNP